MQLGNVFLRFGVMGLISLVSTARGSRNSTLGLICKRNRNGRRHIPQSLDKSKRKRFFASGASSMTEKNYMYVRIIVW